MYSSTPFLRRFGIFAAVVGISLLFATLMPMFLAQAQEAGTDGTDASIETSGEINPATDGTDGADAPAAETVDTPTTIETGNAIASANVINVVNTNVVNSNGLFAFLNSLFGGGFDLRSLDLSYFSGGSSSASCSFINCDSSLSVTNDNDAIIDNTVVVRAETGDNMASSTDGSATISTGDAYASANVINAINTNFLNSNYLLVAFNNFGDMYGDITLPNADFFRQLALRQMPSGDVDIQNNNDATIDNTVVTEAQSGDNTATSTDGVASIVTGDSGAAATTFTQANTNRVGGRTVYMLFNIFGSWSGNVHGLPEGILWERTPTGLVLRSDDGDFSGLATEDYSSLSVTNTNTAQVRNDVQVYALTGENQATGGDGASIETGNAYASANVVNIVNTNVIGQNWILAFFNIFGNWSGNLSFGHPDLWIGGVAETPNPTPEGGTVTYRFTVSNRGDVAAHNVRIRALFDTSKLTFSEGVEGNGTLWNLGDFAVGETREFAYIARAGSGSGIAVPLEATVTATETDNNMADNTETLTIVIGHQVTAAGNPGPWTPTDPKITLTKTASAQSVLAPGKVEYTILVENKGGEAYDTVVEDTLKGPNGDVIFHERWKLDTIFPGEKITLSYTVQFPPNIDPGLYTNNAKLTGQKYNPVDTYGVSMAPVGVTLGVEVLGGLVLGVADEKPMCAKYLTSYIKWGAQNDPAQVRRLQFFLRDFENEPLVITSVYDPATLAAVNRFQDKYTENVLSPWGTEDPTGYVYYTTSKMVNELYCQGLAEFPLSDIQMSEIQAVKSGKRWR